MPPGPSNIQSRAHPFNVETVCAGVAYVCGCEKEQDDGTYLPVSLDEDLDFAVAALLSGLEDVR